MANLIDILKIKPTSVGRDLQGKYVLIYGMPEQIGPLISNY